jgi:uncharacterized protein (DUF2225 family)
MRTGRGRQIAGSLTRELRRNYEVSKQFGEVLPLIYPVTVCPNCYYATYHEDFLNVPDRIVDTLRSEDRARADFFKDIFPALDFTEPRALEEGLPVTFSRPCVTNTSRSNSRRSSSPV